jgi:hypothetical protein
VAKCGGRLPVFWGEVSSAPFFKALHFWPAKNRLRTLFREAAKNVISLGFIGDSILFPGHSFRLQRDSGARLRD